MGTKNPNRKPNKKANRKPKMLTLSNTNTLQVTYHQPGEIPLVNPTDRFALLNWADIHTAITDGRVAAFTCEPGEADTVLRHLYQFVHDQDECYCPALESRYDSTSGRLFVFSLQHDFTTVQKAG